MLRSLCREGVFTGVGRKEKKRNRWISRLHFACTILRPPRCVRGLLDYSQVTRAMHHGNGPININARLMRDIRAIYIYYDIMRRNLITLYVYNLNVMTRHSSTRFLIKRDERDDPGHPAG